MNSSNLLTGEIKLSNNHENPTSSNTFSYLNQNINSSLGKSINNSILKPEEKNMNQIEKNIMKNNKNNNNNTLIKRGKILSSGSLLESSRSSRFNKVIKNGIKIKNIDINDDCEDNENDEDAESVISFNYSGKKINNQNKLKENNLGVLKINGNQLFKESRTVTINIEEDIPFDTDEILN